MWPRFDFTLTSNQLSRRLLPPRRTVPLLPAFSRPAFSPSMKPSRCIFTRPTTPVFLRTPELPPNSLTLSHFWPSDVRVGSWKRPQIPSATRSSSTVITPAVVSSGRMEDSPGKADALEESIEKVIYGCRFLTLFGVWGSLVGSFLCFVKGCTYVALSFMEYFVNHTNVILLLVEAIDVYLLGTVMLVFGMGLYELFVSNLDIAKYLPKEQNQQRSNLFGLFTLQERPQWLQIKSVNELKTKLGHVIVMLLLIGLFEKSKKAPILTPGDLLCFAASVLLSSGCLYLLAKLT